MGFFFVTVCTSTLHFSDKYIYFFAIDLPSMPPGSLIASPSSRRNVIVGGGEPELNVTVLCMSL